MCVCACVCGWYTEEGENKVVKLMKTFHYDAG